MKAEIISIGSEILSGEITDTNANFLARKLTELGIDLMYISAVGDNLIQLLPVLKLALERSDLIVTSGGLGPTEDDITFTAIAQALQLKLVKYQEVEEYLKELEKRFGMKLSSANLKQTYLPEGSQVIINRYGTAPAMILEKDNKIICSFPGVPHEMKKLVDENLVPYLKEKYLSSELKISKIIKIIGLREVEVNELIKEYFKKYKEITLGIYAYPEDIQLHLSASARNKDIALKLLNGLIEQLKKILGNYIYTSDNDTLEEVVGNLLKIKNKKVAVAESCTGGLLGEMITRIPGSSAYFQGGVIGYNFRVKEDLLKVSPELIKTYGEVSEQVAVAMAEGVKRYCHSDIGISITGIAGPGGATEKKDVGLVYMALTGDKNTISQKHQIFGDRQLIRIRAARRALDMLRKYLTNI